MNDISQEQCIQICLYLGSSCTGNDAACSWKVIKNMVTNMRFSSNPYEGARRAFLGLNPGSTDTEWDEFCGQIPPEEMTDEDELIELAALCHAGAKNTAGVFDEDAIKHFCFSAGVFEALISARLGDRKRAA